MCQTELFNELSRGDLVEHVNCGDEVFRVIEVIGSVVAKLECFHREKKYTCKGDLRYPVVICSVDNLKIVAPFSMLRQ